MFETSGGTIQFKSSAVIDAPLTEVYRKLIQAEEQVKWNSLYLEASTEPKGTITNGTVMTGKFKGTGKAIVRFENVIPNREFTHYSKLNMFGIYLGEFRHTYEVSVNGEYTNVTQIVNLKPKGVGHLLKRMLVNSFKKRMPESFSEFKAYLEQR